MKISTKTIMKKLDEVMDPELHISVVDLGLIYKVEQVGEKIRVLMTLTTIGCPLFSIMQEEIKNKIIETGAKASDIHLELTFDPPWNMDRMTKRGKALLGIG